MNTQNEKSKLWCSGDIGPCLRAGHTGGIELTWEGNTVIDVKCCSFGSYRTCEYINICELYNRRPVGFVEHHPPLE